MRELLVFSPIISLFLKSRIMLNFALCEKHMLIYEENNLVFYDEYKDDAMHPGSVKQWESFYNSLTRGIEPECNLSLAYEDTLVVEAISKSVNCERTLSAKLR